MLRYFGFSNDPFGATPDPRCLYPSPTHREALASLQYGFISNRGFTALIAPPGMGKTTLLYRFLDDIRESARTAFLFDIDSQCEPRELVGYILRDLGIPPAQSASDRHNQLSGVLTTEARAGRKVVVVVDEAQNLSDSALEMVRLLTNFETPQAKLMQIVLAGQTQLAEKLMKPSLVQLRQRISTICRLEPLSVEATTAYIDHRVKLVGYRGKALFTREALNSIAEASQGVPRMINNLCFNALSLCCAMKLRQVDGGVVAEVVADQQLIPESREILVAISEIPSEKPNAERRGNFVGLNKNRILAMAALLALCIFGVFQFRWSHQTGEARQPPAKMFLAPHPAPSPANTVKSVVAIGMTKRPPLEIAVEVHQTLSDIAAKYLGSSDLQHVQQIQALNPKLTDPNHIELGQRIRLPEPLAIPVADNTNSSTNVRTLP